MNSKEIGLELQKIVRGEILSENEILNYYSVDSSSYFIKPKVVAIPKDLKDVLAILKFSSKNKIPITARGAGTGLVGSALGNDIILDMKNFKKIMVTKNYIEVDAGAVKGEIDKILKKHKMFLGPNPSVGPYCSIGGMIGTNASGSKSLKYGSIIDNLLEVKLATSFGKTSVLPSKSKISNFIAKLAATINKEKYPKVSKNSCGFRLDVVTGIQNTQKVIAGSEGALGIIISAKLKIFKIPKKRCLFILAYSSVQDALRSCVTLTRLKASALEIIDDNILKNIKYQFPKKTKCLLYIEFDSDLGKNIINFKKTKHRTQIFREIREDKEIEEWWHYRDLALSYSIKKIAKGQIIPHVIEDATVPIQNLYNLIKLVNNICKNFKMNFIFYGHVGNGNLHIRLISKSKNKQKIKKIAKYFFGQVIKLGGTITGEHGDGLARSEFVELQYGKEVTDCFKKLKNELDPYNILNPNKIITKKSTIISNLRLN